MNIGSYNLLRPHSLSLKGRGRRAEARCARTGSFGGFTLVEVLVALAVLAIALAAVLRTMGQSIDLTANLRERTLALWAAQERATEHQLNRDWPAIDTTDGTLQFAGREWRWHEIVKKMPLEQFTSQEMRRVEIEIRNPKSPDVLARLIVYLRQPPS